MKNLLKKMFCCLPTPVRYPFNYLRQLQRLKKIVKDIHGTGQKETVFYNFHRIGTIDASNPFTRLHTISAPQFKEMINFVQKLGPFVSLDDIRNYDGLPPLSFCLTFDDVSSTVLSVIPFLKKRKIPFALCPCTKITEEGMGVRDKVYWIISHYSQKQLQEWIQSNCSFSEELLENYVTKNPSDNNNEPNHNFDFYNFTKTDKVSHKLIEETIVNPLFENIPSKSFEINSKESPYLSWNQLEELAKDPLVTIVNHGHNHYNISSMTAAEFNDDIDISNKIFKTHFGTTPKFFAVPFGNVTQKSACIVTETLRTHNYNGALWVSKFPSGNILPGKMNHQILHLFRNHTQSCKTRLHTAAYLQKNLEKIFFGVTTSLPAEKNFSPIKIRENVAKERILAFENIVRYGRDHSSDPGFYDYMVNNATFENNIPETLSTVDENGQLQSIMYIIPARFCLGTEIIKGSLLSGWRKLPQSHPFGAGLLMKKATNQTPISGAYFPSKKTMSIYQDKGWMPVTAHRFWIDATKPCTLNSDFTVKEIKTAEFNKIIENFIESENKKHFLGIERSIALYKSRLDNYPLAKSRYFTLDKDGDILAFFAILQTSSTFAIVDFIYKESDHFFQLLAWINKTAQDENVKWIMFETSRKNILETMYAKHECPEMKVPVFYYISPKYIAEKPDLRNFEHTWNSVEHHQTMICCDVLLRPGLDTPQTMPFHTY